MGAEEKECANSEPIRCDVRIVTAPYRNGDLTCNTQGGGGNIIAATHLSRLVAAAAVMTGIFIQSLSTAALGYLLQNLPSEWTALGVLDFRSILVKTFFLSLRKHLSINYRSIMLIYKCPLAQKYRLAYTTQTKFRCVREQGMLEMVVIRHVFTSHTYWLDCSPKCLYGVQASSSRLYGSQESWHGNGTAWTCKIMPHASSSSGFADVASHTACPSDSVRQIGSIFAADFPYCNRFSPLPFFVLVLKMEECLGKRRNKMQVLQAVQVEVEQCTSVSAKIDLITRRSKELEQLLDDIGSELAQCLNQPHQSAPQNFPASAVSQVARLPSLSFFPFFAFSLEKTW